MKTITLSKTNINVKDLNRKATSVGADANWIKEDSLIFLEGNLPALYIKNVENLPEFLLPAAQSLRYGASKRAGGLQSGNQKIIGLIPPSYGKDIFCMQSAEIERSPEQYRIFEQLAVMVSGIYEEHLPLQHKLHKRLLSTHSGILDEYLMAGTVFTSGIFNNNNNLNYHKDEANIKRSMSVMLVLRNGAAGGNLHLPEYNTVFECANNSLLIFDGSSILHGVTPIIKSYADAYRISIVFYTRKAAKNCKTQDEEVRQASFKYDEIAKRKVEAHRKRESTSRKQQLLLEALSLNAATAESACQVAGISRSTYYEWLKNDEEFREQVSAVEKSVDLFTKSKLYLGALEGKQSELRRLNLLNQKKMQRKNS